MAMAIASDKVEEFRKGIRGPVLLPGDPDYDEVRQVWNAMIDRKPPIIVRCTGNADVIAAIGFAKENDLPVSIRGGGHSAAGSAVHDDALMIDLSLMNGVHVDTKNRTARVQGGAKWGDFDRETQVYGLASTGGVVSTTGVGGLTLGGGIGWLMGKHGLSVDNLISADVVLASGEVVTASETENPDLYWGLRGGSGNFGVVTSFEFRVHPVGPMVMGGLAAWPLSMVRECLDFYADFTSKASDEMGSFMGVTGAPDGSGNLIVVFIGCHTGTPEAAEAELKAVKEFGPPMLDMLGPIPYTAMQSMLDNPLKTQVYWKATFLKEFNDETRDVLAQSGRNLPTPLSMLLLEHFHGAMSKVAPDATAFADRHAMFNVAVVGTTVDPAENDKCRTWARQVIEDLKPHSTGGVYVNYLGVGDDASRVPEAFGGNYQRLQEIKQKYDPENLFRANQNIKPAGVK
jgi:FAD/FMN-containing dehydrogenase